MMKPGKLCKLDAGGGPETRLPIGVALGGEGHLILSRQYTT